MTERSPASSISFISSFCEFNRDNTTSLWRHLVFKGLTPCVEEICILGTAHFVMILLCLLKLHKQRRKSNYKTKIRLKMTYSVTFIFAANLVAVIAPILQLNARLGQISIGVEANNGNRKGMAPYELVSYFLTILAWSASNFVLMYQINISTSKSGLWIMPFCWSFIGCCETVKMYSTISVLKRFEGNYFLYLYTVQYSAIIFLGLYSCFSYIVGIEYSYTNVNKRIPLDETTRLLPSHSREERKNDYLMGEDIECPEVSSSIVSRLVFSWVTPLLKKGFKQPIIIHDIWKLNYMDRTHNVSKQLQSFWEKEKTKDNPSLVKAMINCYGSMYLAAGIYKIIGDTPQFTGPILLKRIITFIALGMTASGKGYFYAIAIAVCNVIGSLSEAQYSQICNRVGLHARDAIINIIFNHSMKLTFKSTQLISIGTINNVMSQDTDAIFLAFQSLHILWSAPLRIVLSIVLLYKQLGIASFAGAIILAITIPSQKRLVALQEEYTRQSIRKADERIQTSSEALKSMNIVKIYSWETCFFDSISHLREEELSLINNTQIYRAWLNFAINCVPVAVSVVALSIFASIPGNSLTPAIAFTSLALFDVLRFPLMLLPNVLSQVSRLRIAIDRIQSFLISETINDEDFIEPDTKSHAIEIKNTDFSWNSKDPVAFLSGINLEISVGSLIAVIGRTGQGKSSLISAILGEMSPCNHNSVVNVNGKIAYVPQQSWIFNGTIRENILFGLHYDEDKYVSAIKSSCLEYDILKLPAADLTEIGQGGGNLSGGQRQRISIARAVYADADIYLLDDPLSALDAKVANKVNDRCIHGVLKNKTRILVTNRTEFISTADRIIIMRNGMIVADDIYSSLQAKNKEFITLISDVASDTKAPGELVELDVVSSTNIASRENQDKDFILRQRLRSADSSKGILIHHETMDRGEVSRQTVEDYIKAFGGKGYVYILLSFYFGAEVLRVGSSYWISLWTADTLHCALAVYIGFYALLSVCQALLILLSQIMTFSRGVVASSSMHKELISSLFRAPASFFNATPIGRILNRLTRDMDDVDRQLTFSIAIFMRGIMQLFGTLIVVGFTTYYSLASFAPILLLFYWVQKYYQATSRELKRLDAVTRSPIYDHFTSCLSGISSIRSYKATSHMENKIQDLIDVNMRANIINCSCNRWLTIRLEILGALIILISAVLAIKMRFALGPQIAALSLSYALQITGVLNVTVRLSSLAENALNSVERIHQYIHVTPEAPLTRPADKMLPKDWPTQGRITFQDVRASYSHDSPSILNGLSFNVAPKEKIGIVGRTGAGKSTVLLTLFRILEPTSGKITIDGVNTLNLGLTALRSKLSIIPQDPVIFSGSIRFNLDPTGVHTDSEMWKALEESHLKPFVQHSSQGLSMELSENDGKLSVGQKQLLCLARALLKKSSVLVLDEATAGVDLETDSLIQATIREAFSDCTMLTIAHRLNTIIDYDKILVMDGGRCVEFASPGALLVRSDSVFSAMVNETGSANAQFLRKAALGEISYKRSLSVYAEKGKTKLMPNSQLAWLFQRGMSISGFGGLSFEDKRLDNIKNALLLLRNEIDNLGTIESDAFLTSASITPEEWLKDLRTLIDSLDKRAAKKLEQLASINVVNPDDLSFIAKTYARS